MTRQPINRPRAYAAGLAIWAVLTQTLPQTAWGGQGAPKFREPPASRRAIEIETSGLAAGIRTISISPSEARHTAVVEITARARDAAAAAALGYGLMTATVEVDCSPPRDKVDSMYVYSGVSLRSEREARPVPGVWAKPTDGSLMNDIVAAVCRQLVGERPSSPPLAAPSLPTILRGRTVAARPHAPRVNDRVTAREMAKPVMPWAYVVQLGAFSQEGSARALLKALGVLPGGLKAQVDRRLVKGEVIYRAIVAGFANASEARTFCSASVRIGDGCWTHPEGR